MEYFQINFDIFKFQSLNMASESKGIEDSFQIFVKEMTDKTIQSFRKSNDNKLIV